MIDPRQVVVMGKEPVVVGDAVVGYVTSAGFGYSVGESLAYAYLPAGLRDRGTPRSRSSTSAIASPRRSSANRAGTPREPGCASNYPSGRGKISMLRTWRSTPCDQMPASVLADSSSGASNEPETMPTPSTMSRIASPRSSKR